MANSVSPSLMTNQYAPTSMGMTETFLDFHIWFLSYVFRVLFNRLVCKGESPGMGCQLEKLYSSVIE